MEVGGSRVRKGKHEEGKREGRGGRRKEEGREEKGRGERERGEEILNRYEIRQTAFFLEP